MMRVAARGFARTELLAIALFFIVSVCLLTPVLTGARAASCQSSDSDHLRLIVQALGAFSLSNDGVYPLPGSLDAADATIVGEAEEKNTTGQFLSMLIYGGHITPEMCISPVERDPAVVVSTTAYEYDRPSLAAEPASALWDPGFSGTPVDDGPRHDAGMSNQSYAPLVYFGLKRTERWRNRGDSPTALICNRGPTYQGTTYPSSGHWLLTVDDHGTRSYTVQMYGPGDSWAGFVAYDDGAVLFLDTPDPIRSTYERQAGTPQYIPDNLFVDETDDANRSTGSLDHGALNLLMRPIRRIAASPTSGPYVQVWVD